MNLNESHGVLTVGALGVPRLLAEHPGLKDTGYTKINCSTPMPT